MATRRAKLLAGALLAAAVLALVGWQLRRSLHLGTSGGTVLRVSHVNLDPPGRAAFDALAAEFAARHPGVRVEPMPVPGTIYRPWLHTQFIGGTPPDVVEVPAWTLPEEALTYLVELGPFLRQPNPANAGTALAAAPWRDTFVMGLGEQPNFYESILGYYSVPASVVTLRLVYNRHLLHDVYGFKAAPRTVGELAAQCAVIAARNRDESVLILPLVGAGWKARGMLTGIAKSCTASLHRGLDPLAAGWNWDDEAAVAYLRGRWSWTTPAVHDALEQMRTVGRFLPGGATQLKEAEASFPFIQGRAVFYVAVSGEFTTLLSQCDFPLGVTRLPAADTAEARPLAEGNFVPLASLGIAQASPHRALALEFLQFLTSQAGNERFSALSNWLPGIRGVTLPPRLEGFAPVTRGDPPGFSPWLMNESRLLLLLEQETHRLIQHAGSVADFQGAVAPAYGDLLRVALTRHDQRSSLMQQRLDVALAAHDRLTAAGIRDDALRDPAHLWEVEVLAATRSAYHQSALEETSAAPAPSP